MGIDGSATHSGSNADDPAATTGVMIARTGSVGEDGLVNCVLPGAVLVAKGAVEPCQCGVRGANDACPPLPLPLVNM